MPRPVGVAAAADRPGVALHRRWRTQESRRSADNEARRRQQTRRPKPGACMDHVWSTFGVILSQLYGYCLTLGCPYRDIDPYIVPLALKSGKQRRRRAQPDSGARPEIRLMGCMHGWCDRQPGYMTCGIQLCVEESLPQRQVRSFNPQASDEFAGRQDVSLRSARRDCSVGAA